MAVTIAALALLNASMVLPFGGHRSANIWARVDQPQLRRPARLLDSYDDAADYLACVKG